MIVDELKKRDGYEFECNMNVSYRDYKDHDEWGCAYAWLGENIGVEYNFCMQGEKDNCCAIYKVEINEKTGYMETDSSVFEHYEIDFGRGNWKEELENAMCKALIHFFELDKKIEKSEYKMDKKDFFKLCLEEKNKLSMDGIKAWEFAIQQAMEQVCPDKQWYEVTKVSIFNELLSGKMPVGVCEMVWRDVEKQISLKRPKIVEELVEIYTNDKTFSKESVEKFIDNASKQTGWNWDEIARYVCRDDKRNNYLIEMQVPTKDALALGHTNIDIVCYGFEGKLEDYSADFEYANGSRTFNGNWETALEQMVKATGCERDEALLKDKKVSLEEKIKKVTEGKKSVAQEKAVVGPER